MNARREWARHLLAAAPDAPSYGSPEWLALPESSPAKVAAVVRAAECWAIDGDDLEARLRLEVLALSRAYKRAEDAEYVAGCKAWAKTWAGGVHHPDPNLPARIEAEYREWLRGDVA